MILQETIPYFGYGMRCPQQLSIKAQTSETLLNYALLISIAIQFTVSTNWILSYRNRSFAGSTRCTPRPVGDSVNRESCQKTLPWRFNCLVIPLFYTEHPTLTHDSSVYTSDSQSGLYRSMGEVRLFMGALDVGPHPTALVAYLLLKWL
jgi:hypothetical protein